ncbi:MAG: hypothetical protein NTW86_28875, partial [Candidatus Sumerlaeota bacterium]|nr:hypothetical protein [Candidatus Sumerlaeota bacterium]
GAGGPPMDGRSWIPLITGQRKRNWKVVYSAKHAAPNAKLPICVSWLTATTDRWTYIAAQAEHAAELYDVKKDPGQRRNVADKHRGRLKKMQKDIVAFMREKGAVEDYVAKFEVKP